MSELAFNVNGESFEFPPEVTELRVRRMKIRGAPELVYGRDGRPVKVQVTADIDELREAVGGASGKYRLDPLNADGRLAEGVPAAYVQVVPVADGMITSSVATSAPTSEVESVLRDAIRTNGELARTVISTFPAMMESAARLIEAADGAGIPRRRPQLIDIDDEGDEDVEEAEDAPTPVAGLDMNAIIAQVVPVVVMGIMNGKFDLSKVGELFDWRKAAAAGAKKKSGEGAMHASPVPAPRGPTAATKSRPQASKSASNIAPATDGDEAPLPPLDPAAMAHFLAIQSALTSEEAAVAREVASTLSPRELRAWLAELGPLSVPDAVAVIRRHIGAAPATAEESVS